MKNTITKTKNKLIYIIKGAVAVLHIPLLLLLYIIEPFVKFRFGYISTDRIGHFALDLGYEIAKNKNKNKKEINLYFLQDKISNSQLKAIAKRELNVSQWYKYLVYAYTLLGLEKKVNIPYRHKNGSRDKTGIMLNSHYDISLLPEENKESELFLKKFGWSKGEKFVCVNVRDPAFFNESVNVRNSDIDSFIDAVNYLLDLDYWVIRIGRKVNKSLDINDNKFIDYATDPKNNDLLDVWLCKNCEFLISTGTGVDAVAMMFKKEIVFVNYIPFSLIISWVNNISAPKRLFWKDGRQLTLTEHLDNVWPSTFKEKGINIVDLTPGEIKSVVQEMVSRINGTPLTNQQIQDQKIFWNILESHKIYRMYHGVRDPMATFATSYLDNNLDFLK